VGALRCADASFKFSASHGQFSQDQGGPEAAFGVIFGSDKIRSVGSKPSRSTKLGRRTNQGRLPLGFLWLLRRADSVMREKNCLSDRMTTRRHPLFLGSARMEIPYLTPRKSVKSEAASTGVPRSIRWHSNNQRINCEPAAVQNVVGCLHPLSIFALEPAVVTSVTEDAEHAKIDSKYPRLCSHMHPSPVPGSTVGLSAGDAVGGVHAHLMI
jgi:hypothetical protein